MTRGKRTNGEREITGAAVAANWHPYYAPPYEARKRGMRHAKRARKMAEELDSRAQLASEICSISSMFTACTHRSRSPRRPPFVDWYLVLRVES
ncbi:hypothetical protein GW17_00060419 [Ensete ventricosum]|nr:hypothetical protein GW17_00060419 [Ensete ventricosum]